MYLDTSRAIWEPSGQVIRYQGTLVDVTERREMERQLRHKKNFSPRLLESLLPDLILVIDTEGTALSVHIHAI